jgi:hypothetical protein
MPLKVGPDPDNPGQFIWIDSASGQPASQPGGPGTPFVAQSDPSPAAGGPTGKPSGPYDTPAGPPAPGVGTTPRTAGGTGQSIQDVVSNLGGGPWTLKDPTGQPIEETIVGTLPNATQGLPAQTVNRGTGNYFVVVKGPGGVERKLILHANAAADGKVARQSGINDQGDDAKNVYQGDLRDLSWTQSAPLVDVPESAGRQPTPTSKLDRLDSQGRIIAPGDTTTKAVALRDPAMGTVVDIPKDAQGTLTTINNQPMIVKPDGTATAVTGPDGKPIVVAKDHVQINVPGKGVFDYDPSKTGPDAYTLIPGTAAAQTTAPTDVIWTDIPGTDQQQGSRIVDGKKQDIEGLTRKASEGHATKVYDDPNSPILVWYDDQGKEIARADKPGYTPPKNPNAGTAITPDTEAPFTVTIGNDGKPVFGDNPHRITISEAQKQLIQQLGGKVADNTMSEKAAQDLISDLTNSMTARANLMTAQTNQQKLGSDAAANTLSALQSGAQTGAGLLQNRVTAAMGGLNNIVSAAANSKMTSAPAGMASDLVNGLQEWVTGLGGGQPVYDSAAAMINQAAPGSFNGDPTLAQQAYAALRGYMDLYKAKTGEDWQPDNKSFTAPTTAGGAGGAATGGTQPQDGQPMTNVTQQQALANQQAAAAAAAGATGPSTTSLNARGLWDNQQGRAIAAGQTPVANGVTGPITPGLYNPAWQQGIRSAVGQPATGPIGTMPAGAPVQPLPIPQGPWYPGAQPFAAPVTV